MEEKKINIELSQSQYLNLVKLLYIGNMIASEVETEETTDQYDELEQHVLSASGLKKGNVNIGYDKEENEYFLAEDLENELNDQLDEYDETRFWENLVLRLTIRDLHLKYTEKQLDAMSEEKGKKEIEIINNFYISEFDENDLDNVKVVSMKKV